MRGTPQKLAARRQALNLSEYDLRYLRKAIRYRMGLVAHKPRPDVEPARAEWLDQLADWIVDTNPHPPMPVEWS